MVQNIREKIHNIRLGPYFLNRAQKAQPKQVKKIIMIIMTFEKYCLENKKGTHRWVNYLQNVYLPKGL